MPLRPFIGDEPTLPTRRPGEPLAGENVVQTRTPPVPLDKTAGASEWGTFRPNQGPSGTWHWGLDIPARPTTAVVAPESMTVVEVWTGDVAPFVGYGPAGVLAKGDSGVYHLLAHLDPLAWTDDNRPTKGQRFDVGEQVGFPSPTVSPSHVHWEVRIKPIDSPATRGGNTLDPRAWRNGIATPKVGAPSGVPWWLVLFGLWALSKR